MANEYQCPKCKSHRVEIGYPTIRCLACGHSEPLIDYPISYDTHRSLCLKYGEPIPPSQWPDVPETPIKPTVARPTAPGAIQKDIEQLRAHTLHLERRLNYLSSQKQSPENPEMKPEVGKRVRFTD